MRTRVSDQPSWLTKQHHRDNMLTLCRVRFVGVACIVGADAWESLPDVCQSAKACIPVGRSPRALNFERSGAGTQPLMRIMHRILCNAPGVGRPIDICQSCRVGVGAGRGRDCHSRGPGDAFTFAVGAELPRPQSISFPLLVILCFYLPPLPPLRPLVSMTRAVDVGRTARRGNSSHDTRYIRQAKPPAEMAPAGAAAHKISLHSAAQAFSWRCVP